MPNSIPRTIFARILLQDRIEIQFLLRFVSLDAQALKSPNSKIAKPNNLYRYIYGVNSCAQFSPVVTSESRRCTYIYVYRSPIYTSQIQMTTTLAGYSFNAFVFTPRLLSVISFPPELANSGGKRTRNY